MPCPVGCNDCCTSVQFTPEQRQAIISAGHSPDKFIRVRGEWYSTGYAVGFDILGTLEDKERFMAARQLGWSARQILLNGLNNCTQPPVNPPQEARLFICGFKDANGCQVYDLRPQVCRDFHCNKCGADW